MELSVRKTQTQGFEDWPRGAGNPARRALELAGYTRLEQLAGARRAELAKITTAIFEAGGNIVGIGMKGILGSYGDTAEVVLKVQDVSQDKLVEALRQVVNEIMDVREI